MNVTIGVYPAAQRFDIRSKKQAALRFDVLAADPLGHERGPIRVLRGEEALHPADFERIVLNRRAALMRRISLHEAAAARIAIAPDLVDRRRGRIGPRERQQGAKYQDKLSERMTERRARGGASRERGCGAPGACDVPDVAAGIIWYDRI